MVLFERIRRIRKCVLVGGSSYWNMDFEVSEAYHARIFLQLLKEQSFQLLFRALPPCSLP